MKKKALLSLLLILSLFLITGCGKKKEEPAPQPEPDPEPVVETPQIAANQELGWLQYYVPEEYTYQPDLRGLAYEENDRKIYTKGNYYDRNDVIIIDVVKIELSDSITFDEYVGSVNNYITGDNKYIKTSATPAIYAREKYEGKANDVLVYNYTYLTWYNGYVYNLTISGPISRDDEMYTLKMDILDNLIVGENY